MATAENYRQLQEARLTIRGLYDRLGLRETEHRNEIENLKSRLNLAFDVLQMLLSGEPICGSRFLPVAAEYAKQRGDGALAPELRSSPNRYVPPHTIASAMRDELEFERVQRAREP